MKLLSAIIFILLGITASGQTEAAVNKVWLDSIKDKPIAIQLEAIKAKIASDTFYAQKPKPESKMSIIVLDGPLRKELGPCKILFFVAKGEKKLDFLKNDDVLATISSNMIKSIEIIEDSKNKFSQWAECGVVLIHVNRRFKSWKKYPKQKY